MSNELEADLLFWKARCADLQLELEETQGWDEADDEGEEGDEEEDGEDDADDQDDEDENPDQEIANLKRQIEKLKFEAVVVRDEYEELDAELREARQDLEAHQADTALKGELELTRALYKEACEHRDQWAEKWEQAQNELLRLKPPVTATPGVIEEGVPF